MDKTSKDDLAMGAYINALTRDVDELEAKGYDYSRDGEPGASNDLWSEEVRAFADMQTIESLFFSEDWVYIVVDLIAQKISSQKLLVMKSTIKDGTKTVEPAENHPLNDLIANPNELQDYHSWMYNYVNQTILLGNGINWYSPRLKQLITLRTSQVQINFDNDGEIHNYMVYGSNEEYGVAKESKHTFSPKEIIHTRRPNPLSLIWGLSPFVPGRKGVLFNRYSSDYLNSFYLKQATPGMIVEMDRQVNEQTALRQLRSFEMAYTGRRNQRRTMILPKGVKATPAMHTIADQKIIDLIGINRETILALLKVPKHEVGLQDTGSLGSEEYKTSLTNFWSSTLIPTMRLIEGSLNKFFAKSLGENFFFQFDISDVQALQENAQQKADIAAKMLLAGVSVNEVRKIIWELAESDNPRADEPYLLTSSIGVGVGVEAGRARPVTTQSEPDKEDVEDPTEKSVMQPEENLKKIVNGLNPNWLKSVESDLEDEAEGKTGKHMEAVANTTLTSMAKVAAKIASKELKEVSTKAAEIPSLTGLEKLINDAFDQFKTEWETEYVESLSSSVELGYDQQLEMVFNKTDRDKIEVLRARDENGRRATLSARGLDSFASVSKTQSDKIMAEIVNGVRSNDTVDQITRRILDVFGSTELTAPRARTIARTETLTAVSVGQGASIENASTVIKGLRKAWLNMSGGTFSVTPDGIKEGDGRIRDQHLSEANGGVSGEIVPHDKKFSNGLRWPRDTQSQNANEVINCFVGDTEFSAQNPELVYRRFYDGEVVTVYYGVSDKFTVTLNHPILTDKGWKAAGKLNETDQIIKASYAKAPIDLDVIQVKAKASDFFDSFDKSFTSMLKRRIMNFHGDISDSDVEIKDIYGSLQNWIKTVGFKEVKNVKFINSNLTSSDGLSLSTKLKSSSGVATSHGGISSSNLFSPSVNILSGPLKKFSLGAISPSEAEFLPVSIDGDPGNSEGFRKIIDAHFGVNVKPVKITKVDVSSFSGHVYNLQTKDSFYLANGIISHNCRCTVIMLPPGQELNQ